MRNPPWVLYFLLVFPEVCAPIAAATNNNTPVIRAQRVTSPLVTDGRLDEPAWKEVLGVSEFLQKEPMEGRAATEPTRVGILYDGGSLYIGVELLDREPGQIRASQLRRDDTLESDDSFAVILDTFHDHRNAFLFRVNPRGTRFDAVIRNEQSTIDSAWDEQWTAAAAMTERGWTAEISIPFKILRFSGAREQIWGINFERIIKRKNEFAYWSGWRRDFGFHHISQAGHLEGLSAIKQAERLRIRPYVLAGVKRLDAGPSTGPRRLWDVGVDDLKFAVTSNLTADLTLNPDFGEVEVDTQQVNLTRFSLFFREKRQFFVEGADALRLGLGLLHFGPPPLELFHSRRVGLSEAGEPIPIVAGSKLTGTLGGFNLGFLNVQTDRDQEQPGENFTVARFRKEMFGRSYIGAILTNRQGGESLNRVAGLDARFVLKKYLNVMGILARSFTPGVNDNDWVRQFGAEWRADLLTAGINYMDIDPNFDPGIGFVRRRERMVGTRVILKPRPGGELIRNFEITPSLVYFHNDDRVLITRRSDLQLAVDFQSGDRLAFNIENDVERLSQRFPIGPGVTLPVGLYQWNAGGVSFQSFNGRRLGARAGIGIGDFYNGTKHSLDLAGEFRPNKHIALSPSHEFNNIDLPEGSFETHLFGLRADVSFTNDLLTSVFVQYNSAGNLAAIQARLNYIFRTIDNLFVVYNETRFTGGQFDGRSNRSLAVKVTYSFHR
ncbi:MAG: carbohydrate binding family 9 domain-containing protein [Acidobacteria bacterium]|nr:carbohydrate binding family 9 domain-containing protein [Acidobacteriota bacterium]